MFLAAHDTRLLDPDGNRLLQNPTYQVTFNPPPSWTFHVVVGTTAPAVFPGQWATAEQASRTFQGNVRDAVRFLPSKAASELRQNSGSVFVSSIKI